MVHYKIYIYKLHAKLYSTNRLWADAGPCQHLLQIYEKGFPRNLLPSRRGIRRTCETEKHTRCSQSTCFDLRRARKRVLWTHRKETRSSSSKSASESLDHSRPGPMCTVSSTTPTSCQDAKSPLKVEMPVESIDHVDEVSLSVPSSVISTELSETNGVLMVM